MSTNAHTKHHKHIHIPHITIPQISLPQISVNLFALAILLGVLFSCSALFILAKMIIPQIKW